jgi:photosystem II stability/assembly factor-like uncharacterized protein
MRRELFGILIGVTTAALLALIVATAAPASGEPGAAKPAFEHVHGLAFDAAGQSLWLGAHRGLYRSADGGRRWAKVTLPAHGHAMNRGNR